MATRGRTKGSKNVKGKIRDSILVIKSLNPNWSASQIRNYLMRNKPTEKSSVPKLRTIQRILAEGKPNLDAVVQSGLNNPFHLGLMTKYDIPPEVVPEILAVREWCAEEHPELLGFTSGPLTIRQALWIARLHGITRLLRAGKTKGKEKQLDVIEWLWYWSNAYAQYEILSKLSNTPPDTTKLDTAIWEGGVMPIGVSNVVDLLYPNRVETVIAINEKEGER